MKIIEVPLDAYEKELEEFLNKGEYVASKDFAANKKMLEEAAQAYKELHKTKPITLRIKNQDLITVKAKAKRTGIPYQRLISALIHQYAIGETTLIL